MMGKEWLESDFEEGESGLFSSTCYVEKKVKLFGIELNPSKKKEDIEGDDDHESVNSSTTVCFEIIRSEVGDPNIMIATTNKLQKFKCQYCFKEFTNSQALGGHQNAHKKERLKKKNMQLQATKASLSYYNNLHPFPTTNFLYHYSNSNSQISFDHQNDAEFIHFHHPSSLSGNLPDQERRLFTLTHAAADSSAGAAMPVGFQFSSNSSSSLPVFKRNPSCKSLDLQLGLN